MCRALEDRLRAWRPFDTGLREWLRAQSGATDLLPAYRVRLARWREEQAPPSTALPELVETFERLGDSDVFIAAHNAAATTFVLLLSAGLDELLACVAIDDDGEDDMLPLTNPP
jgi:hypothetical protein